MRFGSGWSWLKIVPMWIAIMSGVLSIVRETYGMFAANPIDPKSIFWECARLGFILSCAVVWWQQHMIIKRLENAVKSPTLTPQQQVNLDFVRSVLQGASEAERRVLDCILNHGEIEQYQLADTVKDRDAIAHSLEKWRHKLIGERVEQGTNRTFYFIVPGRKAALELLLTPETNPRLGSGVHA